MAERARMSQEIYTLIPILAMVSGLALPDIFLPFSRLSAVLVAGIFFITALKMDLQGVFKEFKDMRLLALETSIMLVIFPIVTYLIAATFFNSLAVPLMLLAAMPAGMSSPLLTDLVGGRKNLAVVLTLLTSILAPLTIPLVIQILVGSQVSLNYISMFTSLSIVIVMPLVLAQIVLRITPQLVKKTSWLHRPLSVVMLSLIIGGAVADQSIPILTSIGTGDAWTILMVLFVCFILFFVVGYIAPRWRSHGDRLASAICLAYMNFSLAIYIAEIYFPQEKVLVPLALSVLPWTLTFIPFYLLSKIDSQRKR